MQIREGRTALEPNSTCSRRSTALTWPVPAAIAGKCLQPDSEHQHTAVAHSDYTAVCVCVCSSPIITSSAASCAHLHPKRLLIWKCEAFPSRFLTVFGEATDGDAGCSLLENERHPVGKHDMSSKLVNIEESRGLR